MTDKPQNPRVGKLTSGPMSSERLIPSSRTTASLAESNSLVMQVNIPELKVHRKAKLNWDMTAVEAVQQLCRKHRFEAERYALFLPQDDVTHEGETVHLTPNRIMVHSTHEKVNKAKKRMVLTEEDGKSGMWLSDSQELMAYPSLETSLVDLRMKPVYVSVLFQNGEWIGEFRYRPDITLSYLDSLAIFVGKKINEITSSGETSQSYFLVDTTGYNIDTNDEGTWPQTLFFERRNIWLEQTSADLKSQGILAGDILELKSKPKLVRVFIGNRSKMLKYMPTTLVQNVIEELWKGSDDRNEKEDVCDFGIFLSHDGKRFEEAGEGLWLANDKRLASYNLNFNDSLYFSKLPEQQRRKKSLGDPIEQTKSVVVVDIFTSTPHLIPFDFDTTITDIIVEFLQRVSHKHYLSIISDLSLYVPAHDDCMCIPYCSKIQTTTINDPLIPASPLPMRCTHGKWLKDNSLLSQASLLEYDFLEVRQKGYEEGGRGEGEGGEGLVERLQLLPKLGVDEEDKVQKQFMGSAGLLAEIAVVLRPVNGAGVIHFTNPESDIWERIFLPISLSTTAEDLQKNVELLAPSLTLPTSDSDYSLYVLQRSKFPRKKQQKGSSKLGMLASLPSHSSYIVPGSGSGASTPRSSIRSTTSLDAPQVPSLFLGSHQTTFSFPEIRALPTISESDLVVNHLVSDSVLFIFAQERPMRPLDHFQATQDISCMNMVHNPLQSLISPAFAVSLKPPPQRHFVVTVHLREKEKKISVGYEHGTTVKDLAEFVSQLEEEPSQDQDQEGKQAAFGLFLASERKEGEEEDGEAGIWLKEKRTLVSYGLLDYCSDESPSGPIFFTRCKAHRLVDWKRKPVHIDASVFPQLLAFKTEKSTQNQPLLLGEKTDVFSNRIGKLLEVEPFISAEALISKAIQGIEIDEPFSLKDLGLFFPQSSTWLSGGDSISELVKQTGQLQVHIRLRPQLLPISVMLCQETRVKKTEGGEGANDETPLCTITTKVLELDVGKPFKDGVLPGCCTEFGISNAGTFRMDSVRQKVSSGDGRGASAEEIEKILEGLLDLTVTRTAELRGEVKEEDSACLVGLDLAQPLSVQGVDFESDIFLLQYLPPSQDDDDDGGCNIWEEPEASEENIQYEEEEGDDGGKVLSAATLNKLIEELTTAKKVDTEFLHAFLLTYQSFTTPFVFLNKLIQRFNVPSDRAQNMSQEEFELHIRDPIRVRVCNVLRKWIELGFDELTDEVTSRITEFGQMLSGEKSTLALGAILNGALRKAKENRYHCVQFDAAPPPPKMPRSLYDESLSILDIDEEEIARQISIVDFNHFRSIKPPELLNQAWAKPKLQHRARNVLKMISWFNHISKLTSYLILSTENLKTRARVVAKLLTIAKFCRQYNNFGAVMGIIAGFNNAAILRLKLTMAQVPRKSLEIRQELEDLMSSGNSYRHYRTAMRDANPPIIPYMGVHLSDLTFIDEGNPDKLGRLINFGKRKLVSKVIAGLQQYQASPYNLDTVPRIVKLVSKKLNYTDDDLYKMSLLREPRGSQGKK